MTRRDLALVPALSLVIMVAGALGPDAVSLAQAAPQSANVSPAPLSSGPRLEEGDGDSLYRGVCQACHMADGRGARGAASYPALRANPRLAGTDYILDCVLHGRHAMPAVGRMMSDEQVAAVVNYVRVHFGGVSESTVSAADVHAHR